MEPEPRSIETKQEPENIQVEDRYKLVFLQVDKRLVNLELVLGELNEKIKSLKVIDPETANAIQERLDDLEDLIMVGTLGGTELKEMLENINSQINEVAKKTAALSPEEYQKIESSLLQKIDERVSTLPSAPSNLQEEITRLGERIKTLETEAMGKIVSEVTDLRAETSKEIRDVKEKVSGLSSVKPDIDIKFLSSRLNSLKESVEYMLNRKAEIDMNIENLRKALAQIALKVEQMPSAEPSHGIPSSVEQRISNLEDRIGFLADELRAKKFKEERGDAGLPITLSTQIDELLEKIVNLESRLRVIERRDKESAGPIVVE